MFYDVNENTSGFGKNMTVFTGTDQSKTESEFGGGIVGHELDEDGELTITVELLNGFSHEFTTPDSGALIQLMGPITKKRKNRISLQSYKPGEDLPVADELTDQDDIIGVDPNQRIIISAAGSVVYECVLLEIPEDKVHEALSSHNVYQTPLPSSFEPQI